MSLKSWRAKAAPALVTVAAVLLASCGGTAGVTVTKTTATFAELPGSNPNYIFPMMSLKYFSVANITQFQYLMFRPLYWFGNGGQVLFNPGLSLANPPVYSSDGTSVSMTLKGWKWSDGKTVTARDVQFWQNLVTANKSNWAAYSPGEYPDNVTSTTIDPANPLKITFNLSQKYGSYFFTYNELSQISPLPQHLWDKESTDGAVGDYDTTAAGAQLVFKFLDSQAQTISTYNTNPLWQVVDGPWKLKSLDTEGNLKMVPNRAYSGPVKPKLTEFDELPYTSDTTEFNKLKAATSVTNTAVDYGYLPESDIPGRSALNSVYNFMPWTGWQVTYFPENYTNPVTGPIFKQLYFRQAMQSLVDQNTFINKAFFGFGYPGYGPVPVKPRSGFVDQFELSNPYQYSPSNAVTLLQQNGWTVKPGGISTCTNPGSGPGECGPGIASGSQASFKLQYASGSSTIDAEMAQLTSDFAKAGIQINLSTAPFNTVISNAIPCSAGMPCTWDMQFWGVWVYSPDYYPTGDELWSTGAGSNSGGYSDQTVDQLILATETSNDVKAMFAYEDALSKLLPVVWMASRYAQLSEINTHLQGVQPQDPLLNIYPENWYWS